MPTITNPSAVSAALGRPDAKFPPVLPASTPAQLLTQLNNGWAAVGTYISKGEAAWLTALAGHPNADAGLLAAIAAKVQGANVTIGSAAKAAGFDVFVQGLLTPAAPGTTPTTPTTPAGPVALGGVLIPQDDKKVVSTASHDITLSSDQGGQFLPDLQLKRRTIADPEARAKLVDVPAADLANVKTGADFKALMAKVIVDNKAFLQPDKTALQAKLPVADRSGYAFLNIVGRRNEQLFDELTQTLSRLNLPPADAKASRQAINLAHTDSYRGRDAAFDRADTGTYWSYGHDAAFVHVYEKMLQSLPDGDPKRPFLQNQVDFLFSHKYVPHGSVDEDRIEESLDLVAIDKATRHVVSMTAQSETSNTVRYETLQVGPAAGANAGRAAFRDGTQYFLEGTRTELSAAEVTSLVRTPTLEVTFRRQAAGEQLRGAFRYDWDHNRMVNATPIDTGWWGHCDIKAMIETLVGSSRVDLQACKLEYSIVSPK